MVLAAVTAYGCPFASASGIMNDATYIGSGVIQTQEYEWTQSSGDVGGFLTAGQETLSGSMKQGMISVGPSVHRGVTTIDANDHQVVTSAVLDKFRGGGLVWDTARLHGERASIPNALIDTANGTVNNGSPNETVNTTAPVSTTTVAPPRPYDETFEIERGITGNSGMYTADKTIEQGATDTADYLTMNSKAMGVGAFINNIEARSRVGFDGAFDIVNYDTSTSVHEIVLGDNETGYNTTLMTTMESFSTVFMSPVVNNTTVGTS